ncbi:hypothetical protein [Nocardioides sp. GY 10127]|uniref:hypothetical protein n=1 Tax=Nocardioides sp. GY 10127 TaxID=2569762 RepID=UPI0010A812AD|nr:hypothetical protein [Nocardioides sp. GY 10127]TIC81634.1 hypothetical protein E8D37_10535 [Nocardioides sp. GY 10127]
MTTMPVNNPVVTARQLKLLAVPAAVVAAFALAIWFSGTPLVSPSSPASAVDLTTDGSTAVLTVSTLLPGESMSRAVTLTNATDRDTELWLTEDADAAAQGDLWLDIRRDGTQVYAGPFGAMADFTTDQGTLRAHDDATFTFTVSLPEDADAIVDGDQPAVATYTLATGS